MRDTNWVHPGVLIQRTGNVTVGFRVCRLYLAFLGIKKGLLASGHRLHCRLDCSSLDDSCTRVDSVASMLTSPEQLMLSGHTGKPHTDTRKDCQDGRVTARPPESWIKPMEQSPSP